HRDGGEDQAADADPTGRARLPGDDGRLRALEENLVRPQERGVEELPEAEPFIHGGREQGEAGGIRQGRSRRPGGERRHRCVGEEALKVSTVWRTREEKRQ